MINATNDVLSLPALMSYWTGPQISTSIAVFLHILFALFLGLLVGYERSYRGRAAGMRTYGMVCMASSCLGLYAGGPAVVGLGPDGAGAGTKTSIQCGGNVVNFFPCCGPRTRVS